jgi:hypothetical protein
LIDFKIGDVFIDTGNSIQDVVRIGVISGLKKPRMLEVDFYFPEVGFNYLFSNGDSGKNAWRLLKETEPNSRVQKGREMAVRRLFGEQRRRR